MWSTTYVYGFLARQRRKLLEKSRCQVEAPILVEAAGYAGGAKVTQFMETVNKALYDHGIPYDYAQAVRQIMSDRDADTEARIEALFVETRAQLMKVGLSDPQINALLAGLAAPVPA